MLGTGSSPYRYFWGGSKTCFLVVNAARSSVMHGGGGHPPPQACIRRVVRSGMHT